MRRSYEGHRRPSPRRPTASVQEAAVLVRHFMSATMTIPPTISIRVYSHHAANWRPSKRFAPSPRRGLHPTTLARAPRASKPRFAADRSSKRSCSPRMAASRRDDNPTLPDTKPIARQREPPRVFVQSGFNEVRSRAHAKIAPRTSQKPLDSRISAILIQPVGWAEASRRWQSLIRKTCVTA